MKIERLSIQDVKEIGLSIYARKEFLDRRGGLEINLDNFHFDGGKISIKKSYTKAWVGRGLHWQKDPAPQEKIISVKSGKIMDFVVDMSQDQKTIYCFEMSFEDKCLIHIPKNFAHGFIAMESTEFEYICLGKYSEDHEITINILEQAANILFCRDIYISPKDANFARIEIK